MKRHSSTGLLIAGLCVLLLRGISFCPAATYFVSPDGDNALSGTERRPWRTIQHAIGQVSAGDKVYIRGGVYYENVDVTCSGNEQEGPIVFQAYPFESPVIDGSGLEGNTLVRIDSQSHLVFRDMEIRNMTNGVALWIARSSHVHFIDCDIHHAFFGAGIADGSHDFIFDRVTIHHFNLYGLDIDHAGGYACYNGILNDCAAHTCNDPDQNVDGFALGHGIQHDFAFNRCRTYGVYDGFDISASNTVLQSCAAWDCANTGYKVWQNNINLSDCLGYSNAIANLQVGWDGTPRAVSLQNCTFVDAGVYNIWMANSGDALHMENCLLAAGDNIGLSFEENSASNYRGDYNIFHNDNPARAISVGYVDEFSLNQIDQGSWTAYSGQDQHSLVCTNRDALFRDISRWDLHLKTNSPAIDSGSNSHSGIDYDGRGRPIDGNVDGYAACDIGAYEYDPVSDGRPFLIAPTGRVAAFYPTFVWSRVESAQWHWIWLERDNAYHWSEWSQNDVSWTAWWNMQNYPGVYHWWIQPWSESGGYGPWSDAEMFTIGVPPACVPLSPTGTVNQAYPEFTWSAAESATWYRIWLELDGHYHWSEWVKTHTSWTAWWDMRNYPGSYEWWIQPWNTSGYGPWSARATLSIPVP